MDERYPRPAIAWRANVYPMATGGERRFRAHLKGEHCKTKERLANTEPVPASLARRGSFDFVRVAHFAQDDTQWHQAPFGGFAKVSWSGDAGA